MNAILLQSEITFHLDQIEKIIKTEMPYKGEKCNESQKICILNSLNELYANIAGIKDTDLIPDETK